MDVSELSVGSIVTITLTGEGKAPLEIKTTVERASYKSHCALLKPIIVDEKIINFETDKVQISASSPKDGKLMLWRSCKLQYIKNKNDAFHALLCSSSGTSLNRRGAYRVSVDEYCYVNYGKATVDALCVNVSNTGFAYSVGKYDGSRMDYVTCTYHDSLLNVDVKLSGHVVRTEDKGEGRMLFGCRLLPNIHIEKYVTQRQRRLMRNV